MTKIPKINIKQEYPKNKVFPEWHTANTIITETVMQNTGVYITVADEDKNRIDVSFINPETYMATDMKTGPEYEESTILRLVPPEDKQKFSQIIYKWVGLLNYVLDVNTSLEPFLKQPLTPVLKEEMRLTVENEIGALRFMGVDPTGLLLYMMGVR